jgi:hypothetical protein
MDDLALRQVWDDACAITGRAQSMGVSTALMDPKIPLKALSIAQFKTDPSDWALGTEAIICRCSWCSE